MILLQLSFHDCAGEIDGASHMLPAIDVQLGARHVARLIRAQIIDRLGDLLGQSQSPQRDCVDDFVGAGA